MKFILYIVPVHFGEKYLVVLILYALQAIVVFGITIHSYALEKSEMEEISMVALSGCIWLQAFVVAIETK